MKLTYSIKCVLRPDKVKADGTAPIYLSVRIGADTTRLPSGKSILLKDWNKAEGGPKNNTPHNKLLSTYLSKQMSDWSTYMLTQENLGKSITRTTALEYFRNDHKLTFYKFWDQQLLLWQNEKRDNTLKSYRSALKMLKAFNPKLDFGDLTYNMVQQFDLFMANERNNAVGGRFVKHKCLKSMINQAIMNEHIEKNPYRHFKIKASTNVRNFLSIAEVKTLMNLEIPADQVFQQKTKDMWLFSAYTGLRYSDIINLKWENIVNDQAITVRMTKTSKIVTIPLIGNSKDILEKYGKYVIKTPQGKIFPQIANQVLNRNIKELMKAAGIDKVITYHSSRHTLASNLLEGKTNPIVIKDILGQARMAEMQRYAHALESDLYGAMNNMQNIFDMPHAI
jgi:integrase/recombinase XerD